jgi:hypothetical protein
MKNIMNNIKLPFQFLISFFLLTLVACNGNQEEIPLPPTSDNANFSYSIDPDNPNKIIFSAQPNVETWYTHWSFGDNTSAEGLQAEKIFFLKGAYEVRFKIFTESGTAETTQIISIAEDIIGPNLIENGELDNDSEWTILPISGGAEVTFQNGTAIWTGGGWGHVGIYQLIEVEANTTYQIQMDVAGSGMSDCWFEVYVGKVMPMDGVDYTDGGIRLGLNTWDGCGSDPFEGPLIALSCSNGGGDGTFEFPNPESVYLVIRSGGADLGAEGVTVDNISIRAL